MKIENWFTAVVENITDPLNGGRVQIRCWEYHGTDEQNGIASEKLPYASPILPVTGVGTGATGLKVGDWVFGFFRDIDQQEPVIIGSIPGIQSINGANIPADASNISIGGNAYNSSTNVSQYGSSVPGAAGADTSAIDGVQNSAYQTNESTSTPEFINNFVSIARNETKTPGSSAQSKYGATGLPWCAAFLTYCIKQTGAVSPEDLPANPLAVVNWINWPNGPGGKYVNRITNPSQVLPGDIIIRDANQDHIGIVSQGGSITGGYSTIEGNSGAKINGYRQILERKKNSSGGFNIVLRWKNKSNVSEYAPPVASDGDFTTWFNAQGFKNINASTVLAPHNNVTGGVQNQLPPKNLWPNIVPTLRVIDELCGFFGSTCRINSAYRSPAYNRAVGGAVGGFHPKFQAIDLNINGKTPRQVHSQLMSMRNAGKFRGGLGLYGSFVHVDTRGTNANW